MNKIGWCDMTFNPCWGCRNKCEYCYARVIAKRFAKTIAWKEYRYTHKYLINSHIEWKVLENALKNFKPTFLESQFDKKFPKKPQRIFVGSMSEIAHWKAEWMNKVIFKIMEYPQHTFQFLTKHPRIYYDWAFPPENCWLGITVTGEEENGGEKNIFAGDNANLEYHNIKYISFDPLLQKIYPEFMTDIDWVIIGAETGNRKGKVIPKLDWVLEIVRYCEHNKIPVYIKDNLVRYYHACVGYKQFPVQGE